MARIGGSDPNLKICECYILLVTNLQVKAASIGASGGQAARAELGLGDDFYATSSGQRERMLQSTEKLARTGDRITQGRQQLLETEVSFAPRILGIPKLQYMKQIIRQFCSGHPRRRPVHLQSYGWEREMFGDPCLGGG